MKKSCLVAIFILHFLLTYTYLLHPIVLRSNPAPLHKKYFSTIFRQNWHMFAPDPLTFSSRLIIKCNNENDWIDPMKALLEKHSRFPLIHNQKTIFLFNSISQTLLDSRSEFKKVSKCHKVSLNNCEDQFKLWIKTKDAFMKAEYISKEFCLSEQKATRLGVYIEHAKSINKNYKIANQGIEILELN